jgi:hypothetical protein
MGKKTHPYTAGLCDKYIELLKERIRIGLYKPSQSSYQLTHFCVQKKNGVLQMVHDLQPLNTISIHNASIPPILDEFVESFAGCKIYTVLDIIPANPEIRAFVQKHAQDINRVFHCIACSGGTFSAKKTQIAMPEVLIVLAYDHIMRHMSGICRTYLIRMFGCLVSLLRSPAVEVQGPVFLVVLLILMYSGVARAHSTPGRYLSIAFPSGRACAHSTPASQIV